MLVGPRKSGRTLIGLQYAMECADQKEVCLYFTSMRPKDLMIQAASIDFDLQHYMNQNLIIVVRVAPPSELFEVGNPDEFLIEYLNDIVTVVEQYQPNKIVFDELTPFIGFNNINLLQEAFGRTIESIEEDGITSLFILGDPATPAANSIVEALTSYCTGTLYLQKTENQTGRSQSGIMTITPNIGHNEGQFRSNYVIEPYKGVTVNLKKGSSVESFYQRVKTKPEDKYKSITEYNAPPDEYSFTNFYSVNDFYLILNNQIALFKSTGQIFTIVSFRLDRTAEKSGLLTLTQLQNAIRLSTDKKDKICILSNKVIVLVTKEDPTCVNNLISKIKTNLPGTDPNYLQNIMQYIAVFAVKVDESIRNADDIFHQLMEDEPTEENKLGFY